MNENDDNSESYEIEPCQVAIPGIPLIAPTEDFEDGKRILIAGLRTFDTSIKKVLHLTEKYLKTVRQDLRDRRCKELLKLLETRPEFYSHPWIREEICKWIRTGRSFTKRGRRIGTFGTHPLIVVAAVDEVIVRQTVYDRESAFQWLADQGWHEYDTAKKQYYHAINEERFRAVLIQNSNCSTPRPRLKARRLIRRADHLHAGQSITRTLHECPAGPVTVIFTAI